MPPPGIELATPCFPAYPSNHSAIGAVEDKWIKLLQYLFTLRYYKNLVWCAKGYIEKENINHCLLTVSWLIPSKYEMINTREAIYYVLYVIDYIWYLFFFIYYCLYCLHHYLIAYIIIFVLAKSIKGNKSYYFNQYRCYHMCDNASMKLIMICFVHSKFCKQK